MDTNPHKLVDAIESGRIVRVPESYAKREGLLILKKPEIEVQKTLPQPALKEERKERMRSLGTYHKKKPDWKEKQVISELIENFHWQIRHARRQKGWTRRQLAKMINVHEEDIQFLETGRLPTDDFVLINKVQQVLGINLRKDGKTFEAPVEDIMEKLRKKEIERQKLRKARLKETDAASGNEIEIFEDEI